MPAFLYVVVPCYDECASLLATHATLMALLDELAGQRRIAAASRVLYVDDGSTDDTLAVLERYAAKGQRIRIINAPHNCGLQWARHRSIKAAQGQWIMFVDVDDFITEDYVMRMHSGIAQTGADAAMTSMNYNVRKRLPFLHMPKHTRFAHFAGKTISQKEFREQYLPQFMGIRNIYAAVWAWIYRRDLFEEYELPEVRSFQGEDLLFNATILPRARKISGIDCCGYYRRDGGFSKLIGQDMEQWWSLYHEQCRVIKENDLPEACYSHSAIFLITKLHWFIQKRLIAQHDPAIIRHDLAAELQRPEWGEVVELAEKTDSTGFVRLVRQGDADAIIEFNRRLIPPRWKIWIHRLL